MRCGVINEKYDGGTVSKRGMYLPDLQFNHKGMELSLGDCNLVSTHYHEVAYLLIVDRFTSTLTTSRLMSMSS